LNTVLWGYGGYDALGNVVEELQNPQKNIARAMILLILSSTLTYLVALLGAVSIDSNYSQWSTGYFVIIAKEVGFFTLSMTYFS
jgi:amino acid transporter